MVKIHIVAQTTKIRWTIHLSIHVSLVAKKIISCAIVLTWFVRLLSELKMLQWKLTWWTWIWLQLIQSSNHPIVIDIWVWFILVAWCRGVAQLVLELHGMVRCYLGGLMQRQCTTNLMLKEVRRAYHITLLLVCNLLMWCCAFDCEFFFV